MNNVERIIRATLASPSVYHLPADLTDLTKQGWEVVERFEVDEVMLTTEQVLPPFQNGYQPPPIPVTREQLGKQSYFRLCKSGETVLGELSMEIAQLNNTHANDLKRLDELDKEATKLKAEIAQVRASLKSSYESNEALRKQKEQVEQIKRQLEGDIGKIREHVGRKTMDEVLHVEVKK